MRFFQLSSASIIFFSSMVRCAQTVSKQVELGANSYFLPPTKSWSFQSWMPKPNEFSDEFLPLTVVRLNNSRINPQDLRAILESYNATDDVWTPNFTKAIFFEHHGNQLHGTSESLLAPDYTINNIFDRASNRPDISNIPLGPYFLETHTGNVYRAYKLVNDFNQAFIQSSYQDENYTHHPLAAASMSAGALTIGIPSRLYYTKTRQQPLAGLRLAVKDLYDLRGLRTSGGNRALYEMSQSKNATALPVQKLIDAGAVVVGKNHLSEFAFAGIDVPEHVDYVLPFNPRGDGYSSPSDSSGGSGAAVASYDWLDVSMGSDTGGSIRGPAMVNGVMGSRPSTGAVDLSFGVLPLSPAMDTSGVLVRDPKIWSDVNKVLYSGFAKEYPSFPKKIYIHAETVERYSEATGDDAAWWGKVQDFVKAMAKLMDAQVTPLSIDTLWNSTSSSIPTIGGKELGTTINWTYGNLTTYDQWNDFGRKYVHDWMATHAGEFPPMVPNIREGWLKANTSITPEMHRQSLETVQIVREWVEKEFLRPDNKSCSDAVFLTFSSPAKAYKPDVTTDQTNVYMKKLYEKASQLLLSNAQLNATILCDENKPVNSSSSGACEEARATLRRLTSSSTSPVAPSRLASVAGYPDFVITLGEMATENTNSDATLTAQAMPWSVSVSAARKCDFMLQDLVSAMARGGIIKGVKTGKHVH
ncbi:amidase signature domain-containing protein [Annulohypoxylon maeteangense]|uniref:amidase signature domain-containing protein n=1 Tax=Annulohypoxylon maeteangense TaxID=1927788 RepID=UPI002007D19F|nr:amidase signature domain-containing protein [Annulohypoxylon maeteangense]KAI0886343.1 amidase signature domain-containing protein [Annulohypoxylon maeteangense]